MFHVVLAAAAVASLEASCESSLRHCYYNRAGVDFGDHSYTLAKGEPLPQEAVDTMCMRHNWVQAEACHQDCPLQMEVLEPASLRMKVCVTDNAMRPYDPTAHLREGDPRLDKEFTLVTPGSSPFDPLRFACTMDSFMDGKSYAGKAVVANRGACHFFPKGAYSRAAGGVMTIVTNTVSTGSVLMQHFPMTGPSDFTTGMPIMLIARHHGAALQGALDMGAEVKVALRLNCAAGDKPVSNTSYLADECPHPGLIGRCGHMEREEDRLCRQCAMMLTHAAYPALRVCLWSSSLLPRLAGNQLWTVTGVPAAGVQLTYVAGLSGCAPQEFAGLRGKVVVLSSPTACLPLESVLAAQGAGVAGVVFLTPRQDSVTVSVEGPSAVVRIPVHSVEPRHWVTIDTLFRANGVSVSGTAPGVEAFTLSVNGVPGVEAPHVPVVTQAPEQVESLFAETEDSGPLLEATPAVVVSAVLLGLLVGACVWKVYQQRRLTAMDLPKGDDDKLLIPLGVASMGLSLSLLLITAAVAFALTFTAGQRAKDTALDDGRRASDENYASAVANIDTLAQRLRRNVGSQVMQGLNDLLDQGEHMAASVTALYFESNSNWTTWIDKYDTLVQVMHGSPRWRPTVITTKGFYFAIDRRTRETAPGLPPISVTNNGSLYAENHYRYDTARRLNVYIVQHPAGETSPPARLGTFPGDPVAFTRNLPFQHKRWYLTRDAFMMDGSDDTEYDEPLSVYTPIYNVQREYLGLVQTDLKLADIGDLLQAATSVDGSLQNMTVVVFDGKTNDVVATPQYFVSRPYLQKFFSAYAMAMRLYKLDLIPPVELIALKHFLDAQEGAAASGVLEQAEWYRDPEHQFRVLDVWVGAGVLSDIAEHEFKMEMRGACASTSSGCIGTDGNTRVMQFDGTNTLFVYKNMTLDSPDVKLHRTSLPSEPYATDYYPYRSTIPVPGMAGSTDSEVCVTFKHMYYGVFPLRCHTKHPFLLRSFTLHVRFRPSADVLPTDSEQQLVGDSVAGESMLRLYASGAMKLDVMSFGCRTDPVAHGVRGGQWHTYTVVVDRRARTCTTYVNGTVHSTGKIALLEGKEFYSFMQADAPYAVGHQLRGDMSTLRAWDMPLVAEEVEGMYEKGAFARHVPQRKWFTDVRRFVRNTTESSEIDWRVGVMIPRADIMRQVDANNAVTQTNLGVRAANLRRQLRQESYETVLIVCVTALVSVLVFLVFNDAMTRPFARVAAVMADAAVMRVDEIPEESSALSELHAMHRATALMLHNLQAYRTYLPSALLEQIHGETESRQSSMGSVPGLSTEEATIVFTDIRASTSIWEAAPEAMRKAIRTHNDAIRNTIAKHGGYEVKTIGDAFMVSFEGPDAGLSFALDAHEKLLAAEWPAGVMDVPICQKGKLWGGLTVRIGVNHGPVNVEVNSVTGRVDYFGHTVNVAARLEGVCVPGGVSLAADVWADVRDTCPPCVAGPETTRELKGVSEALPVVNVWPLSLAGRQQQPLVQKDATVATASSRSPSVHSSVGITRERCVAVQMHSTEATIGTLHLGDALNSTPVRSISLGLEVVMPLLEQSRGTLISLLGQHVWVGWNLVRSTRAHAENALRFAQRAMRARESARMSVGLASGKVEHGDVGTSTQRFVTAAGNAVEKSLTVWRLARDNERGCVYTHDEGFAVGPLQELLRETDLTCPTLGAIYELEGNEERWAADATLVQQQLNASKAVITRVDQYLNHKSPSFQSSTSQLSQPLSA